MGLLGCKDHLPPAEATRSVAMDRMQSSSGPRAPWSEEKAKGGRAEVQRRGKMNKPHKYDGAHPPGS